MRQFPTYRKRVFISAKRGIGRVAAGDFSTWIRGSRISVLALGLGAQDHRFRPDPGGRSERSPHTGAGRPRSVGEKIGGGTPAQGALPMQDVAATFGGIVGPSTDKSSRCSISSNRAASCVTP